MNTDILAIESFLQSQVNPFANDIDRQAHALKLALDKMGDLSWLGLKAPPELGGNGMSKPDYGKLQLSLARASGALAFLQTQHQSAVASLAQSKNISLQQEFFPGLVKGITLIGVGFSHLRRHGMPIMQATKTVDGYLLTGKVPWITGYGFFDYFILGATLPDGKELYGVLPLQNQVQSTGGEIICSQPMDLIAMTATNTISAKINQWLLKSDRLVKINPAGAIHVSSRKKILHHSFFLLGCAYAGLDILQAIAKKKQLEFLQESWHSLHQEIVKKEQEVVFSISDNQATYEQQLKLRIETINLAQRCSQAAVIASSGAANYLNSSAGRVYREALLFTVSAQTTEIMAANLKSLLRKN